MVMRSKFSCFSFIIVAAFMSLAGCSNPPTDAELIKLLEDNRGKFQHLVEMLRTDSALCAQAHKVDSCAVSIRAVGEGEKGFLSSAYTVSLQTFPKDVLTVDRLEQYILKTESIPLESTDLFFSDGEVRVGVFSKSFLVAHWGARFVFRPSDPTPLVESLDGWFTRTHSASSGQAYRKLNDDWYILATYVEAWP
jgi:hypothetical protein